MNDKPVCAHRRIEWWQNSETNVTACGWKCLDCNIPFEPKNPKLAEIQRRHDVLRAIILEGFEKKNLTLVFSDIGFAALKASMDVLCWLLDHENNDFETNFINLEAAFFAKGIIFQNVNDPCSAKEKLESLFSSAVSFEPPDDLPIEGYEDDDDED